MLLTHDALQLVADATLEREHRVAAFEACRWILNKNLPSNSTS